MQIKYANDEEHKLPGPKWKNQEQNLNNSCLNLYTKIGGFLF